MVPLEVESNIEVLRQMSLWMRDQIKDLAAENQRLRNATDLEKQAWLDKEIKSKLHKLQAQFFSSGRETAKPKDSATKTSDTNTDESDLLQRNVGHGKKSLSMHGTHATKEGDATLNRKLPLSDTCFKYLMSARELESESLLRGLTAGAEAWELVEGLFQASHEITITERTYQKVLHRQAKYRLKKEFNYSDKEVLITAPGPAKLRPASKYSIDFAVSVALDKYLYHLPLERQRRQMKTRGLDITPRTLYGFCEAIGEHCAFVVPMIRNDIFNDFCATHIDETPWPIISTKTKGRMWIVSNRIGSVLRFEPSRAGAIAEEMLEGYSGAIVADAYVGYDRFKNRLGIRLGLCWSHLRRAFHDIRAAFPAETAEILKLIDDLFKIERDAKSIEELIALRKTKSKDKVNEIHDWMIKTKSVNLPRSDITLAINYGFNHWNEFTAFLRDITIALSNNDAERSLRHPVLGRKNYAGSKTIDGADVAANIFTVVESAKKVGLEPRDYLKYLIEARWYGDEVKSPYQYALEKFGHNDKVIYPDKSAWEISSQ